MGCPAGQTVGPVNLPPQIGRGVKLALTPAEQPFDIAELQFDIGRSAVIACPRARRSFHFAQQRIHLLRPQPPSGAHRAVAGHRGRNLVETLPQTVGRFVLGNFIRQVADQSLHVGFAELTSLDGLSLLLLKGEHKGAPLENVYF